MCKLEKVYHLNKFTNADFEAYFQFEESHDTVTLDKYLTRIRQNVKSPWEEKVITGATESYLLHEGENARWDRSAFLAAMAKYVRSGVNFGEIKVTINVGHDHLYQNGVFAIDVVSSGAFVEGKVILDFNATTFEDSSWNTTVPGHFQPLTLPSTNGTHVDISDVDPIWFVNCKMHCNMKYTTLGDATIPGSKLVQKTCYYCPTVGVFFSERLNAKRNGFTGLQGNSHVIRVDGHQRPTQRGNPFEALADTNSVDTEEVGPES
ncbi:hypothetical protein EC991_002612 [Linnemannia zychae]|nr:hypothetical protein EC991_002612 [Linnemannia zychae]